MKIATFAFALVAVTAAPPVVAQTPVAAAGASPVTHSIREAWDGAKRNIAGAATPARTADSAKWSMTRSAAASRHVPRH